MDASLLEELDKLSVSDKEQAAEARVWYEFTYNSDSNVVTISPYMSNADGEIEVDELKGIAFYNDAGNIDAVINMDGEAVLLSEMCDTGIIQNCGRFSKLFRW